MTSLSIDASSFVEEFIGEVPKLAAAASLSSISGEDTRWTKAVKLWLATKCAEYGCRPIYTDGEGGREFMLDLVWWTLDTPSRALLGCESEWGNRRYPKGNVGFIAEDFDKLLSFKAPFKIMVFTSYSNDAMRAEIIAELDRYLREFGDHRAGEQYVLVDMCEKPVAWHCRIGSDVPDANLAFHLIHPD